MSIHMFNNGSELGSSPGDDKPPVSYLWVPYVSIAVVFVGFLCFSFLRYHQRHRERYQRKLADDDTKFRLKQRTLKHLSLKSYRKVKATNVVSNDKLVELSNADNSHSFESGNDFIGHVQDKVTAPVPTSPGRSKNVGIFTGESKCNKIHCDEIKKVANPEESTRSDAILFTKTSDSGHGNPAHVTRLEKTRSPQNASLPIWIASEHFEISSISGGSSEHLHTVSKSCA